MEHDFIGARLNSTRINKYLAKQSKNNSLRNFVFLYTSSDDKTTKEIKEAVCMYKELDRGVLQPFINDSDIEKISDDEVEKVFNEIKEKSGENFIYFYQSYTRKIEKGYNEEFVNNAFSDLKTSYYIYRKVNNPMWDLTDSQITECEMQNLYNILVPMQEKNIKEEKIEGRV